MVLKQMQRIKDWKDYAYFRYIVSKLRLTSKHRSWNLRQKLARLETSSQDERFAANSCIRIADFNMKWLPKYLCFFVPTLIIYDFDERNSFNIDPYFSF